VLESPLIAVCCPGRLIDLIKNNLIDLTHVSHFIVDEFDKMLEMGFDDDIRFIKSSLNMNLNLKPVQVFGKKLITRCTSATITDEIRDKIKTILNFNGFNIIRIDNLNTEDKPNIKHFIVYSPSSQKLTKLNQILVENKEKRILVFLNLKTKCKVVYDYLKEKGVNCGLFNGDFDQKERDNVIQQFKAKSFNVLICSDLASRGLNLNIDLVIN